MGFLQRKIKITYVLLILLIPLSLFLFYLYNSTLRELEIRRIHSKCRFIHSGMKLSKMYEILDTDILPEIRVEYNNYHESYHHYVIFPIPLNTEFPFTIEFDKNTQTIINFNPNNCLN